MSRLTWQNVAAPDFSAATRTQAYAAEAFDKAMGRVSDSITAFDNNRKDTADAAVMRNMMQYQNANELQAAIASGALMQGVNPDHVRADALLKAQSQASNLLTLDRQRQQLSADKQTFDFNAANNPLRLEESGLKTTQLGNDIAHTQGERERATLLREAEEAAKRRLITGQQDGTLTTDAALAAAANQADVNTPEGMAFWNAAVAENPMIGKSASRVLGTTPPPPSALPGIPTSSGALVSAAAQGGFDNIVPLILQHEGGYVAKDGKSGAPANFGINQKHNPDIDVKNLTQADATKLYKERYWDAISGDKLPAALQATAFDAAVNQGPGMAKKWITESGGDVAKFNALREQHYRSLAASDPEHAKQLNGWLSRLSSFTTMPSSNHRGAADYQAKLSALVAAGAQDAGQNDRLVKTMVDEMAGKVNTSLQETAVRHRGEQGMFKNVPEDHMLQTLREVGAKLGTTNYEFVAQWLANETTTNKDSWVRGLMEWAPGVDKSGKYFDLDRLKTSAESYAKNGKLKLFSDAAASFNTKAAITDQQAQADYTTRLREQYAKAYEIAAKNPTPENQAVLVDLATKVTAAGNAQVSSAAETFSRYLPAGAQQQLAAQAQSAAAASPATPAPAAHSAEYATFLQNFGKSRTTTAPEAPEAPEAPPRRIVSWPEPMTPARISTMTAAEAAAVLRDPQKVRRLPPNVKLMLEARAGA